MIQVRLFDGSNMDKLKTAISDLGGLSDYNLSDGQLRCMVGQCYYLFDSNTQDIFAVISSERVFTDDELWDQTTITKQAWDYRVTHLLYDEYALEEHSFSEDDLTLMINQICKDKNDRVFFWEVADTEVSTTLHNALINNKFSLMGNMYARWWNDSHPIKIQ